MKIMIVDDNATVRRVIRRAVSEIADEIVECPDGAEVQPLYTLCLPDVVLMDIRMPRVDGLTATRRLKTHFPRANVLIVTDIDDESVRSAAMEAGACGFASKENLTQLDELILAAIAKNGK